MLSYAVFIPDTLYCAPELKHLTASCLEFTLELLRSHWNPFDCGVLGRRESPLRMSTKIGNVIARGAPLGQVLKQSIFT